MRNSLPFPRTPGVHQEKSTTPYFIFCTNLKIIFTSMLMCTFYQKIIENDSRIEKNYLGGGPPPIKTPFFLTNASDFTFERQFQ